MPATLVNLVEVRSELVENILDYLNALSVRTAELPKYYPDHLRSSADGRTGFDEIRQIVQVVKDRRELDQWWVEERERSRRAGHDLDRLAYAPRRSRPETLEGEDARIGSASLPWDEYAGERFHRAVILGDPGFGKTWLLRWEARRLARQATKQINAGLAEVEHITVPIWLRLSELNETNVAIEDAVVLLVGRNASGLFRRWIYTKLRKSSCALLLDAWDEVPVKEDPDHPQSRQALGRRLKTFATTFSEPRILISSRIVGFGSSPIPGAQELELLAFDRVQVESFVRVWLGERMSAPFLKTLEVTPQVQSLARLPLILALLCREYGENNAAFTRRGALYERCLRGLLRDWNREDKARETITDADVDAVLDVLRPVALALFIEGHEQFSESTLREKMLPVLRNLQAEHELHGTPAASLIEQLKRDGILVRVGEYQAAPLVFLHRTFQEYLSAGALADKATHGGERAVLDIVNHKVWLPEWQEVITLLAGEIQRPQKLLTTIIRGTRDDYFRHRLGVAALCLLEIPQKKWDVEVARLADAITKSVFKAWWQLSYHPNDQHDPPETILHLSRALGALGQINSERLLDLLAHECGRWEVRGTADLEALLRWAQSPRVVFSTDPREPRLDQMLKVLASSKWFDRQVKLQGFRESEVMSRVVDALTEIGAPAAEADVLDFLVALLRHRNYEVVKRARKALGQMRDQISGSAVPDQLMEWLCQPDLALRRLVVDTLRVIGGTAATPRILQALEDQLRNDDFYERMWAMDALGALGGAAAIPSVQAELVKLLHSERDYWGPWDSGCAAETLREMGIPELRSVILNRLAALLGHQDYNVRVSAAKKLGRWGPAAACASVLEGLVALLEFRPNDQHRNSWDLFDTLRSMGASAATPEVLKALLNLLDDEDYGIRGSAAWTLGVLAGAVSSHAVREELLARVRDVRATKLGVASAIGWMGESAGTSEIVHALATLLNHDDELERQKAVLSALGAIGRAAATSEILEHLIRLMDHNDLSIRESAITAVGKIGGAAATPPILTALLKQLNDAQWEVRRTAALAIEGIGTVAATPRIARSLFERLHDQEWEVIRSAVDAFGSMGQVAATSSVIDRLLAFLQHGDLQLRCSAVRALYRLQAVGLRVFTNRLRGTHSRHLTELANQIPAVDYKS